MQFRSGLRADVVFAGCIRAGQMPGIKSSSGFPARDLPSKKAIFSLRLCRLTADVHFHRRLAVKCAGLPGHVRMENPSIFRHE